MKVTEEEYEKLVNRPTDKITNMERPSRNEPLAKKARPKAEMGVFEIVPVAKPRMTRRDKWLNPPRPGVAKYRAFCNEVTATQLSVRPSGSHVLFVLPMPTSWSKQKKEAMNDQMHQQTPDLDNLAKALFDALFENDCQIHDVRLSKVWGHTGRIEIRETI